MFSFLADKLGTVIRNLKSSVSITEKDFEAVIREIRISLIEADVSITVIKSFVSNVKEKVVGQNVLKKVLPGQMIVKIVYDEIVKILGGESRISVDDTFSVVDKDKDIHKDGLANKESKGKTIISVNKNSPSFIMLVGLQGHGKTTTAAKLGLFLRTQHKHKSVLLVSVDVYRPAAHLQLTKLGKEIGIDVFPHFDVASLEIVKKLKSHLSYDIIVVDTAGRLQTDDVMMDELLRMRDELNPTETLFVVDAMVGQSAIDISNEFHSKIGVSGIILTKMDGDARGGAALSVSAATGCPVKMMCVGEKMKDMEIFDPKKVASRILGMDDVVSFVEKIMDNIDSQDEGGILLNLKKNRFDMTDLLSQIRSIKKMGSISNILAMIPGLRGVKSNVTDSMSNNVIKQYEGIISSMTPMERTNPDIINGSRKLRIAKGSGVEVQVVNRLIKQYYTMTKMMKQFKKIDVSKIEDKGMGVNSLIKMLKK